MQDRQPGQSSYRRMMLLCGVAVGVLAASSALADPVSAVRLPIGAATVPTVATSVTDDDGLGENGFYLEANTIIRDDNAKIITARGDVEARYQGRTIRAQELIYNVRTGIVTARGKAQIIADDGSTQSAEEITLDNNLQAGVAYGFSTVMAPNIKFAAASAVRRSETVNELNRAIYTPCDICTKTDAAKTPSPDASEQSSATSCVSRKTRSGGA
jgi:LPS-assembly protein